MSETLRGLYLLQPTLFIAGAAMLLLVVGAFSNGKRDLRLPALMTLLVAFLLQILSAEFSTPVTGFGGLIIRDGLSDYGAALLLVGLFVSLLLADPWFRREGILRFEWYPLVLLSGVGMLLLVSAHNFMTLYIGLELQSLALYVLATFHIRDLSSAESGVKYFILGSLASGILLFGISLVYGFSGTLDFSVLAHAIEGQEQSAVSGLIVGLTLVVIGLGFKLSAVPFHMWTPDVYEGAPTPVTALFAIVPKVAAVIILARLMLGEGAIISALGVDRVLWALSFLSMLWGALAALGQTHIKRLLAYSAIGNAGYALMGIVAGTEDGLAAMLVYMTIYLVTTAGVFAVVLSLRSDGQAIERLEDLKGFAQHHPLVAVLLGIFLFSLAGIPPLAGFFGKFYVFRAALESGEVILAITGALTSVVAAFYYLRLIRLMCFDSGSVPQERPIPAEYAGIMAVSGVLVLLFLLAPSAPVAFAQSAATSLFP